ncbi:MAG: hypothetical protein P8M80_13300 [Pirellulaceae bacterium]|nr:hypothetical protein [Pirellulaceae bacterium]
MKHHSNRRQSNNSMEPGQDAFLDVVANLVGILIILVVLIGSQARSVWEQMLAKEDLQASDLVQIEEKTELANLTVNRLIEENETLENEIQKQSQRAELLTADRDRLQLAVQAASHSIQERKNELSEKEKKDVELSAVAFKLQVELDALSSQSTAIDHSIAPNGIIEHLPTPIAKTVFGEEVHFRLQNGQLVHVPLDDLVELMRSEWNVKAKKLTRTPSTIETVGPIDAFRLQYKLVLKEQTQQTEYGIAKAMTPALERFILIPVREQLGEPFEKAMLPGSKFTTLLGDLDPAQVTVSIWVYPDSFGYFNRIKKNLSDRGFLCAGWPLPEGQPISGSPEGFRTAAQ